MIRVTISRQVDFPALGRRWRDLESRSAGSFFLSWTWIGCLAEERFPDPVLAEATEDGRTVALALFNRCRRWGMPALWLHETGSAEHDCPYIEQNGVLAEAGREAELTRLCLLAVLRRWPVTLSAIDATTLDAVREVAGIVHVLRSQASPFVDLAALRASGTGFLTARSGNTRRQILRSERYYAEQAGGSEEGGAAIEPAATVEEAWAMLDALAALHQESWNRRGAPGSFGRPFFRRFHRALIERGLERGEIALQKISFSDIIVGYLYNLRFRGRILAYQSGFHYDLDASAARPGLVAHAASIRRALGEQVENYDFLAGEDRYKRSLSDSDHALFWIEAGPAWSPLLRIRQLAFRLGAIRRWGARRTREAGGKRRNSLQVG